MKKYKIIIIVAVCIAALAVGVGIGNATYSGNKTVEETSKEGAEKSIADGWQEEDGKKYYYEDNEKEKGWLQDGENWYYLDEKDGSMKSGWQQILSDKYYFNKDGILQKGWIKDKTATYYGDNNGKVVTGWQDISGNRYFFGSDGKMFVNTTVEGHYLGTDGIMKKYAANSFDDARALIMKNDGVYVNKCMNGMDSVVKLEDFKEGYVRPDILQGWTFPEEEYYFSTLTSYDPSGEDGFSLGLYLVGKESGNVYVVPFEGGKYTYRTENNTIVEKIPYESGESAEWR